MAALEFEWDPAKEASNRAKHGIDFAEAVTAFDDPHEVTVRDPRTFEGSIGGSPWVILLARTSWSSGTPIETIEFESSVRDRRRRENGECMSQKDNEAEEMLPEYDFSRGERGKYYQRYREGTNVVLLDSDVARVFHDSAAVNAALRQYLSEHGEPPANGKQAG